MAVIFEVAFFCDSVMMDDQLGFFFCQNFFQLFFGPTVEFSFLAFAVGIFSRIPSAILMGHISFQITDNITNHVRMSFIATH